MDRMKKKQLIKLTFSLLKESITELRHVWLACSFEENSFTPFYNNYIIYLFIK